MNGVPFLFSMVISQSVQLLSHPTLCDPMKRGTPGLPVHHQLLEFTQTHVHRVSDAIQPSHPPSSPSPPAPQSFPASGLGYTLLVTVYNKRKLLPKYLPPSKNIPQNQKWPVKGAGASIQQYQCYAADVSLTLLLISLLNDTGGRKGSFIQTVIPMVWYQDLKG